MSDSTIITKDFLAGLIWFDRGDCLAASAILNDEVVWFQTQDVFGGHIYVVSGVPGVIGSDILIPTSFETPSQIRHPEDDIFGDLMGTTRAYAIEVTNRTAFQS